MEKDDVKPAPSAGFLPSPERCRAASAPPSESSVDDFGSTEARTSSADDMDVTDLRRKMASSPVIEQAKGMLMGRFGCDEATAFEALRRSSQSGNVKLRVLCADMVAAAAQPHREPSGSFQAFLRAHHLSHVPARHFPDSA